MIGKPYFLPCFEYMHLFYCKTSCYGFRAALWAAVFGSISIFLSLFSLCLCWDKHFKVKGQVWAEVVRMDKRLGRPLETLRSQVHVAFARAPFTPSLLWDKLGNSHLSKIWWRNCPFSFYSLSYFLFFPFHLNHYFLQFPFGVALILILHAGFFFPP